MKPTRLDKYKQIHYPKLQNRKASKTPEKITQIAHSNVEAVIRITGNDEPAP